MAREHARIWLDINADDDFADLPFDAQGFYARVILTESTLNYCGVADWRPRRLTVRAPDLTLQRILAAAGALEAGRYLLFDLDTEEVLARSYIRRDELLRNPKFAAAVIRAYAGVASKTLRAAVVDEIRRIHKEHPEYSSWSHKEVGPELAKIMAKPGSDLMPYTNQITNGQAVIIGNPYPVPNTNDQSVPNTNPDTGADTQSQSVPIPSTYTHTPTPAPLKEGGYVTGERHQGDGERSTPSTEPEPNERPASRCARHRNDPNPPACRACADARVDADRWDEAQRRAAAEAASAEARQAAEIRRAAIDACSMCDENGYVGTSLCHHDPKQAERNAAGVAKARAALDAARAGRAGADSPAVDPDDPFASDPAERAEQKL